MRLITSFFVPGIPRPKGSMSAYPVKLKGGGQKVIMRNQNPETTYFQNHVKSVASREYGGVPVDGPLTIISQFYFLRPPSVRPSKRPLPTVPPDLDKLIRCILDAMTGIVYIDDSQVTEVHSAKFYGERAGVLITVIEPSPIIETKQVEDRKEQLELC